MDACISPQGSWLLFLSILCLLRLSSLLNAVLLVSFIGLALCWPTGLMGWQRLPPCHPHSLSLVPSENTWSHKCQEVRCVFSDVNLSFLLISLPCSHVPGRSLLGVQSVSQWQTDKLSSEEIAVSYIGLHITNVSTFENIKGHSWNLSRNTQCQVSSQEFMDIRMSTVIEFCLEL